MEQFYVNDNSLTGSLPASLSAWKNVTAFWVSSNSLTGSLPASLSAWKKVTGFSVSGNKFSGVVPALDTNYGAMEYCYLLDMNATNAFSCPFPQGVTEKCVRGGGHAELPITNADCHVLSYRCIAGQCAVAATGVSKTDCEALCNQQWFTCTNNTCVQAVAGVPRAACEAGCGPAQRAAAPLLLE
jgi:hypothetical protein